MTELGVEDRAFAADHLFGTDPSPRPRPGLVVTGTPADWAGTPAVDLDGEHEQVSAPDDPNAGAKRTARWLAGAVLAAVVAIVVTLMGFTGSDPASAPPGVGPVPAPVAPVAAPSTIPAVPDRDGPIAYTASANCPAGSTSAGSLSGGSAWTCVRGQQGARVDGQVLHVDFGASYVLSAVSVTPGWVSNTSGGQDQWLRHRVVSRLQYVFDDADRTIFAQDTGNAHGPVTATLPRRVLASRVTVIVLQTSRPPASPTPSGDSVIPPRPGFGDSLLGTLGAPPAPDGDLSTAPVVEDDGGEDPVDATFAISALTFLGHPPR